MFFVPRPEHYILPTERRILRIRHHWMQMAPVTAQTVVLIGVLVALATLLSSVGDVWVAQTAIWYLEILLLLRLGGRAWQWWDNVLIVTDERFMRVRGVISSTVSQMPVKKVTDINFHRSPLGLWVGYGDIRIESAGQVQELEHLRYIPEPDTVFEAVAKLLFSKGLPPPKVGQKVFGMDRPELETIEDTSQEWPERGRRSDDRDENEE